MQIEGVDHLFWPAEVLLLEGVASLEEIETWYSLDDIMNRFDAMAARNVARERAEKLAAEEAKKGRT